MRLTALVRASRFAVVSSLSSKTLSHSPRFFPPTAFNNNRSHQPCSSIHTQTSPTSSFLLAGHSHWQNIKSTKEAKDKVRCNMISGYIGKIRKMIAQSGNPDPKTNSDLAKLIEEARSRNVPKDSIDRALKNSLRGAGSKVVILEARGPGGVALILECLTDKMARLRSEVGWILKKNGGQFMDSNSIKHQFAEKGTIDSPLPENIKADQCEDIAIMAEAEEFIVDDASDPPSVRFLCDAADMFKVRDELKSQGFPDADGQIEFLPQIFRPIDEETNQKLEKLITAVEEHVEVLRVYNNADVVESEVERRKN